MGSFAYASTLSVQTNLPTVNKGGLFTATVLLNTESKSINTIEGSLVYNPVEFTPERINIGSSFISFWVDKPTKNDSGTIHFSGIVPGGISADKGEIFNVVFRANVIGNVSLSIDNAQLLLNDGQGTKDSATTIPAQFLVTHGNNTVETFTSTDTTPPEPFKIQLINDTALFDGAYSIVFSTQDKGTGVDHYSVCELLSKCEVAESPYKLKRQNIFYHIIVTAYDADGNKIISKLTSPWLYVAGIVLCFLILFIVFFVRRKIMHIKQ